MNEKDAAKEKFHIIHNAYSILSDATKKKLYDDGTYVFFAKATVTAHWENYLKPVNSSDIEDARKKYQGSIMETNDIIREFVAGRGSMTHVMNNIPFMRMEDESRIIEIIKHHMNEEKVEKFPIKKIKK